LPTLSPLSQLHPENEGKSQSSPVEATKENKTGVPVGSDAAQLNKPRGISMRDSKISIKSIQRSTSSQSSREYDIQINIPAQSFRDATNSTEDKEVEFSIDFAQDDVKVCPSLTM
jgi:hypothetical protein